MFLLEKFSILKLKLLSKDYRTHIKEVDEVEREMSFCGRLRAFMKIQYFIVDVERSMTFVLLLRDGGRRDFYILL
jgi:hypothetical protein